MKFGENLYNLRKKEKMTQEELAEKMEVSRQSVSKWENGEAYPEMNRIFELCKIFHCNINELINDNIADFNSLDEEIKMSVVKFNKEKQKRLKIASKTIAVCSKVLQIITMVISIAIFVTMFFAPSIINSVEINNDGIIIANKNLQDLNIDEPTAKTIIEVFNTHSKTTIIIYTEIIIACLIVSILLISFAMKYVSELFKSINEGDTPFTLENLKYIKKIAILFISYLVFPDISGTIFQWITKINMNIDYEIAKVFYILIILCIYYVFDYGHQIQLDSKGKVYGDGNE